MINISLVTVLGNINMIVFLSDKTHMIHVYAIRYKQVVPGNSTMITGCPVMGTRDMAWCRHQEDPQLQYYAICLSLSHGMWLVDSEAL